MGLDDKLRELRRQNAVVLYGLSQGDRGNDHVELGSIVATAAEWLSVPYAAVHVLDDGRQVTLAANDGRAHPPIRQSQSICATVLEEGPADVIEIPDTADDPRLQDNPFVDGELGKVRFYAATPLITAAGAAIGTLCVVDHSPRTLDDHERRLLLHLGHAVLFILERRRRVR